MVKLPMLLCKRCAYRWVPRIEQLPKRCPRCKSYSWNVKKWMRPRGRPRKER